MNIRRLWAVVNVDTNEVLYSSFDYNRAKKAFDSLHVHTRFKVGDAWHDLPSFSDLFNIKFLRFDISRHYSFDECFQKEVNKGLSTFLDFILMKSGDKNNNTNIKHNEVKSC